MTNLHYGDAESLHQHFLKFAARSPMTITHGGNGYTIHHTQFASFELRPLFRRALEETTRHPRDEEFEDEFLPIVEESAVCLTDRDLHYHFSDREYIDLHDMDMALSEYRRLLIETEEDMISLKAAIPSADTRGDAIAEVFTYYLASTAGNFPFFNLDPVDGYSDDDYDVPDEGLEAVELVKFALRDTVYQFHGPSALRRPDPTLHTIRTIYHIYDEIGMNPDLRDVYKIFIHTEELDLYKPKDAQSRRSQALLGNFMNQTMGMGQSERRWINPNEPPIESLDSYERHEQS